MFRVYNPFSIVKFLFLLVILGIAIGIFTGHYSHFENIGSLFKNADKQGVKKAMLQHEESARQRFSSFSDYQEQVIEKLRKSNPQITEDEIQDVILRLKKLRD